MVPAPDASRRFRQKVDGELGAVEDDVEVDARREAAVRAVREALTSWRLREGDYVAHCVNECWAPT